MFTETELREALAHSAGRADDLVVVNRQPPRPRPWLLPLAAAAAVATLAVGVVAVLGVPTGRPTPGGDATPLTTIDLVDLAVAGVDADYTFADAAVRASGGQHISRALGRDAVAGTAELTVLPAAALDRDRVQRGRPVAIAGVTGWLAQRTWTELDGQEGAAPGQDDPLPRWTIAFTTPGGDWAFASIATMTPSAAGDGTYDDTTVADARRIVAAYDSLKMRWQQDAARQPLRLGVLPSGLRLHNALYTVRAGRVTSEQLRFVERDDTAIEVVWSAGQDPARFGSACSGDPAATHTCTTASRTLGTGRIDVEAFGAHRAASVPVLDGITVAGDPADYVGFDAAVNA